MAGDGEELRILSEIRAREAAASELVERARREGEKLEKEARELADANFSKLVGEAHARASAYLGKAQLEAQNEALRIKEEAGREERALEKTAEKRVGKAVDLIVDDLIKGAGC